jgi:signal transduction histidine kinase
VQEALTNVRKHAAARKVIVTARLGESLLICVSDDGVGLTQGRARRSDGIGLRGIGMRSMRERAAILGAKLEFLSEEGRGLMVRLEVPLEAGARGGDYV